MNKSLYLGLAAGFLFGLVIGGWLATRPAVENAFRSESPRKGEVVRTRGERNGKEPFSRTSSKKRTDNQAEADAEDRLRSALHSGNRMVRFRDLADALSRMTPENAREMREVFSEFEKRGIFFREEWRMLWGQWGRVDPAAAITALANERNDGTVALYASQMIEMSQIIFTSWGETDPAAATQHLSQISDGVFHGPAYLGLLEGMPLADATALASNPEIPNGGMARRSAEILAERSLRETGSVEDMKTWYARIEGEDLKNEALGHVCWRLRKTDFDGAADWLRDQGANGINITTIAGDVANEYAVKDPAKGLEWYMTLPEGSRNPDVLEMLRTEAARGKPKAGD